MKKVINFIRCKGLIFIGIFLGWNVNADEQIKSIEAPIEWTVSYLKDGKTRLEFVHGDKTHFYEVKLIGIDIDGESINLTKPVISVQKNQVTKQWLPFLKETWIETGGNIKWSFEIKRPDFLPDSAKQITLKYHNDSDGEGGATVPGYTSKNFDTGDFGKTLHELSNQTSVNVKLFGYGSRCDNAVSISGYPNKNKSVVFKLKAKSFPLYTQEHLNKHATRLAKNNFYNSNWNQAKFSEQNNIIQLVVPTEIFINDQYIESINIFQLNNLSMNVVDSIHDSSANTDLVKANENEIFGFIKIAEYWYQLLIDKINLNKWETDKEVGINHLEKIKKALSSNGNLDENYFFGQSIVIHGEYLYAVSNDSETNNINIFKKEGNQWAKQNPIVIQRKTNELNSLEVFRKIEEVIVMDDLMVVPMTATSYRTPLKSEDNQSFGEVRIYRKVENQWLLVKILAPEIGNSKDSFGEVVVVGNNMISISANRFSKENNDSLNGLVHIYNYESGQWQKPVVIKPPNHAKESGYYNDAGFGSQLQLHGDDIYVEAGNQGYSSNNVNQASTSVDCPYFDSFGVIYHYRKVGNIWKLLHEIKSNGGASRLIGPMIANSSGLYFLSLYYENSLPVIYMKHYSEGKIKWQKKLLY